MKKYIHKVNQYLIENYPTIWNTRIIWMLLVSFIIHLIFFVLGYFTLSNPEMLHEQNAKEIFFKNGVVFFNIIMSVIMLVVWLIYLFNNNAFKNFYPISKLKLFAQFISYLIIIFVATTFYYSYNGGLKTYISSAYPNAIIAEEIAKTNDIAVFFPNSIEKYTVDNLNYPTPFYDLYCEKKQGLIDKGQPYISYFEDYQFYSVKHITRKNSTVYRTQEKGFDNYVYYERNDSTITYFFKDKVIDVSKYLKTNAPSYYNFSDTFFAPEDDEKTYENSYYTYNKYAGVSKNKLRARVRNKQVYELLNRKDETEIKTMMTNVKAIFDKYHIDHNLSVDKWFDLVYKPENFEIFSFLRTRENDPYETVVKREQTEKQHFVKEHTTDYFISTDDLKNTFYNIEKIKEENYYEGSIHIFMWITFILSVLVFLYRISSLRSLLFAIVTIGVLVLFISLFTALYRYIYDFRGDKIEYFISYLSLVIGAIIFMIPFVFLKRIRKSIVAVFMNISIAIFPMYILLIVGIISMHQRGKCIELYDYNNDNCFVLIDRIGINLSFLLFVLAIAFIYFYSLMILKWKSLPEG